MSVSSFENIWTPCFPEAAAQQFLCLTVCVVYKFDSCCHFLRSRMKSKYCTLTCREIKFLASLMQCPDATSHHYLSQIATEHPMKHKTDRGVTRWKENYD